VTTSIRRFEGKVAVITGAASGMGRETAKLFHAKGWFVGAYDVNTDGLATLAQEIGNDNCITGRLDVTNKADFDAAVSAFGEETGGRMDMLHSNAGIGESGWFEDVPFESALKVVQVNLIGAYLASRQSQRVTGFAALAVAMAAWNFGAFIYPHSYASADPVLMLTRKIDRELPKNATIYYGAFSPDDWYLDYFAPGRKWVKIVKPQDISAASGPFCLETTALATWEQAKEMTQHWELVNAQHNVRLECFRAPR